MRVGIAISLIGAVVGELSNAAGGGLGVRLLTGSYNGQTIQIWAALLLAAALAAVLVVFVGSGRACRQRQHGDARMTNLQRAIAIAAGLTGLAGLVARAAAWRRSCLLSGGSGARHGLYASALCPAAVLVVRRRSRPGRLPWSCSPAFGVRWARRLYLWLALAAAWLFSWLFIERLSDAMTAGHVPRAASSA